MEDKNPLVSVIVPTHNRAELISETLDSILAQTYTNWECIIVDDGSIDNTKEVVKSFIQKDKRFKLYDRPDEHKPGGNGARNFGLKKSKGKYIQWFDSDDIMHPEKLKYQVNSLINNKNVDLSICYGQVFVNDANKNVYKEIIKYYYPKNLFAEIASRKQSFNLQSLLFKRVVIKENELFNEQLLRSQEYEFISRIFLKSPKFVIIKKVLFFFRKNPNSITSEFLSKESNYIYSTFQARKIVFKLAHREQRVNRQILIHILTIYYYCLLRLLKQSKINYVFKILYQVIIVHLLYPSSILLIIKKIFSKRGRLHLK